MCRIFAPLAFALTVFVGANVLAQPVAATAAKAQRAVPPLTLASAVQFALDNNPDLSASQREIDAAQGALTQAGAYQNPTLSVEVEDVRRDNRTTTVLLSQPIELGGKRAARMAVAERAIEVARAQLDTRQAELRANVTAAFFAALTSHERVRLAQDSLDLALAGSQAAQKRVTAGKVSPVEETRAKVAEANVRLELIQAQGELQTNLQALRTLLAGSADFDVLDGSVLLPPVLPSLDAMEQRIANAPALRQARLEVRRLAALADLESAKRVPDITVTAGIQRAQESGRSQAVIGFSVPLPLFDTNRGNIAEAISRRYQAEDQARAAELRLRGDVAVARQLHRTASSEVATFESDILPGAQSAYEATRQGFELGKFGYLEALDAQRTLLQARAQHLRSVASVYRAASDLDRLLGNASPAPVFIPVSIP